jgi:hypothetical protein
MGVDDGDFESVLKELRRWSLRRYPRFVDTIESEAMEELRKKQHLYRGKALAEMAKIAVGVANNVMKREFRRLRVERERLIALGALQDSAGSNQFYKRADDLLYAQQLIAKLCVFCQSIISLRFVQEMTLAEIAREYAYRPVGCDCHDDPAEWTTNTVYSRLENCVERLRQYAGL